MINAKIIADSKNQYGDRLTTFVVTFPRIVLAEANTHRMFSRNSASSRAIPFKKMIKSVRENPFIPIAWQKDHSGMQGTEYFSKTEKFDIDDFIVALNKLFDNDEELVQNFTDVLEGWKGITKTLDEWWLTARDLALEASIMLSCFGVTKQLCNRLLEPFMYHTVIITSSDYENFFALRAHEAAEIHIAKLAELMLIEYNSSTPKLLNDGEWHIPFGDNIDESKLMECFGYKHPTSYGEPVFEEDAWKILNILKVKVAIARCARVSYTAFGEEGKPDNYQNDIKLYDRLNESGHYSPFEHVGRAMSNSEKSSWRLYYVDHEGVRHTKFGVCGNFVGFLQYRKTLRNENRKDTRVLQK